MEREVAGANFRAGCRVRTRGGRPMATKRPVAEYGVRYRTARKGMLHRSLKEEQAWRMDERLTRVVQIIVEQYDGDVKAFVESIRYRVEVNQKTQAASDHGDEAVWGHV